jgi:hypothetical protein
MRKLLAPLHVCAIVSTVVVGGLLALASPPAEAIPVSQMPAAVAPVAPAALDRAAELREGCEVEERSGACVLEAVSAVEGEGGDREVVAVYRAEEGGESIRVERRYRVSYLAAGEGRHMSFLRAHPTASCRWQTVVHGVCPAHPATVEVAEAAPSAPSHHRRAHARAHTRRGRRTM